MPNQSAVQNTKKHVIAPAHSWAMVVLAFFSLCTLCGCSSYTSNSKEIRSAWELGNFDRAAKLASEAESSAGENDKLIWQLDSATTLRAAQKNDEAHKMLEAAAGTIIEWDKKADVLVSKEFLASITNLASLPYRGKNYDRIMLHTYRALSFLEQGKRAEARVALNAAFNAQSEALQRNAKEIEKAKKSAKANSVDLNVLKNDKKIAAAIRNERAATSGVALYKDYVNPFTTWLHGIYFLHAGEDAADLERARKSLERVAQMVPANKFLSEDIELCKKKAQPDTPLTYVIFEYGTAPTRTEIRIDTTLPIPIGLNRITFAPISIALPKLVLQNSAATPRQTAGTTDAQLICDMNSVVKTDFSSEYPVILARTLTTAFIKSAASAAANAATLEYARRDDSGAAAIVAIATLIGTSIYTYSSSGADTRTWQTLPQTYSIAKIVTPKSRELTVNVAGHTRKTELLPGKINLVFVKSTNTACAPIIFQSVLK